MSTTRENFDHIPKILLIGETGSGKSTLINYFCNYFHQGDLNHLQIAIPYKQSPQNEYNLSNTAQTKTNTCTQYMFTDRMTEKQYLLVDTPGLSDTRGSEQNKMNMDQIIDTITKLGNLSTIIIVVNGSISRLTTSFRSILTCLYGNLPDIVLENVIVVLTNAKKHESPFDLRILNLSGNTYPFYMQNNAFVSDSRTWRDSIRNELELDWNYSMKQIQQILQTIESFEQQISIEKFIEMKQMRNDIKLILHQMRFEFIHIRQLENELTQIQTFEIIDAPYNNTLCLNCHQVCHRHCCLYETTIAEPQISCQCSTMIDGYCQKCRNHCSSIDHYYAKKTIRITEQTIENIFDQLQLKYNQQTIEINVFIEQILKQTLELLQSKSLELCQICSSFDLVRELKHLIRHYKNERNRTKNYENDQFIRSLIKLTRFIDEYQENKTPSKQSTMKTISHNETTTTTTTCETKPKEVNNLKTNDLIDLYNRTNDRRLLHSIFEELHRRVQGKSFGPLLTTNEIMLTNKFIEKYKQNTVQELNSIYRKLQNKINQLIGSDIFKIVDIDLDILIENFILHTLLDEKEKDENNSSHSQTPYPPYPTERQQTANISSPVQLGFSHILTAPYPIANEIGSLLPSLPQPDNHQSTPPYPQTPFPLQDSYYDPIDSESLPSLPMKTPQLSNVGFSFPNLRQKSTNEDSSIPDVISSNQSLKLQQAPEIDVEKYRSIDNSRLLLMYANAVLKEKQTQLIAIHNELYQRCFGDNPLLMKQNQQLLKETLQLYQEKTFDELQQAQINNQQEIRKFIRNDDVTLIDDIPVELVVEAHALKQLILSEA